MHLITPSLVAIFITSVFTMPTNLLEERQSCSLSYSLSYNLYFGYCSGNSSGVAVAKDSSAAPVDNTPVPVMLRGA